MQLADVSGVRSLESGVMKRPAVEQADQFDAEFEVEAKVVIEQENPEGGSRITRERFEILANEICSIFIHEHPSVYFTASVKQGEQILVTSGKLWNHYNYSKSVLRKANLLKNLKRNGPANLLDAEKLEQINESDNINWLSKHLEPWEEVHRKWTESYAERRSLLVEANLSVYEYIDKFACLKVQRAYELFHIDFKLMYPDKQQITIEQWTKIKPVLIENLASCGVKGLDKSVLINILKTRE
ncbi:uncharacterized protein LOC116416569 [Nasonia vitripennis]|uniref:Uncharacterized protein n=1 Tax=Nasonia vitripennis TaxID=7425 RepID=A0A7M7Q3N0_NASVI|nr:uncharacterized protein LOC116416569 [Nasonia vitripennis]